MDYIKMNGCYRPLSDEHSSCSPATCAALTDITKVGPDAFARQITLIELSLFKAIKREEFASLKWNGKEKHLFAPNIVASTRWFNQTNFWVQKEILTHSQVSKRTELLSFFIKVAKKLVDLNNLYSAMSIISALQVECVYRLRHTWDGLNSKDRAAYRRLEDLFSQDNNCRRQREHMNSVSLPGIPYLGVYLSDLTYTNIAHPRVGGKPTAIWISKINTIIDTIAYFQQSEYHFTGDDVINAYLYAQKYIEELQKFIEEDNYRTSLRLEPPPQTPSHPNTSHILSLDQQCNIFPVSKHGAVKTVETQGLYSSTAHKLARVHPCRLKTSKSASVNSSFESDLTPALKVDTMDNITPTVLPKVVEFDIVDSNVCSSTPLVRRNKLDAYEVHATDEPSSKLHSCICSFEKTDKHESDPRIFSPPGNDSLTCEQNHHGIHHCYPNYTLDQLPPIPPRPLCDSDRSLRLTLTPHGRSKHSVCSEEELTKPTRSNSEVAPCCLERPRICVPHLRSTVDANCETAEDSRLNVLPVTNSSSTDLSVIAVTYTTTTNNHPQFVDAAAAAVCAATVVKGLMEDYPTGAQNDVAASSGPPQSDIGLTIQEEKQSVCEVPVISDPTASSDHKSKFIRHCRSASTPVNFPFPRHFPITPFGVHVVHQGPLQRRTMVYPHSNLAALLSPRLRKISTTAYESTSSSLSTLSAVTEDKNYSLMHTRPAGFSTWHRFWATLVLVGSGSAAFIIYFEAKHKNAVLRNEFKAHQCQIQSLLKLPPTGVEVHCLQDKDTSLQVVGGTLDEALDLLTSDTAVLPPTPKPSPKVEYVAPSRSYDSMAHVDIGRHKDGTMDPHSFLLSNPNCRKVYRLRPIDIPIAFKRFSRPLHWFRRSSVHSPQVKIRCSQGKILPSDHALPCSDDSAVLRQSFVASGSSSLPRSRHDSTFLPLSTDSQVNQWIRAIQVVLNHLQNFQKR